MNILRWTGNRLERFIDWLHEINPVVASAVVGLLVMMVVFLILVASTIAFNVNDRFVTSAGTAVGIGVFMSLWSWIDLRR